MFLYFILFRRQSTGGPRPRGLGIRHVRPRVQLRSDLANSVNTTYLLFTGKFSAARNHAETSLKILGKHLPSDHLSLASSKRVLALILEEIAIDSQGEAGEKSLLNKAEDLHLFALNLAKLSFGECNVQTAKHYGNLGRLYQTMERYEKAEKMHLKAIQIKETLLGPEDYEVSLSCPIEPFDLQQCDVRWRCQWAISPPSTTTT